MSEAPQSGQVVGGKYRVRQCLGAGGMGAVYEAENLSTGKRVALKWLHPHLVDDPRHCERFMREAKVLGRIRHPNVVDLYDVGREHDSFFLVLEYLEGESLGALLDREELRPIPEMLTLLIGAMRGVGAAHKQDIVHRDLKPDNIFLARENDDGSLTPKLLDFGISKFAFPDSAQLKLTATGSIFGTPRYMSYEQLMGLDVDARADVYSFGVILYEALTGKAPYPASSFQQLVVQFSALNPAPPRQLRPEISRDLERVILSTLDRDRERRPRSIEELIKLIQPFTRSERELYDSRERQETLRRPREPRESRRPVTPAPAPVSEPSEPRRSFGTVAAVAVAVCASIGAGWTLAGQQSQVPELPRVVEAPAPSVVETPAPSAVEPPKTAPAADWEPAPAVLAAPSVVPDAGSIATRPLAPPSNAVLSRPPVSKPKPTVSPAPAPAAPAAPVVKPTLSAEEQRRRRTPRLEVEQF